MTSVLDFCDAERGTGEQLFTLGVILHDNHRGLLGVRKHKLGVLTLVNADGANGVVNKITVRRGKLLNGIAAWRQTREVDFAVYVSKVFL